ncbi:MAG TPA: hypothetical protein VHK63_06785 [Candidatus Limnocylindria bacterium]|nr:hypothetical protein [Candidatus Limnocylindria bacterium]
MDTPRSPERRLVRPVALLAALSALGLTFTMMIGPALAAHVEPILHQGNPTCGDLGDFEHEFKIEPVTNGLHEDPNSDFAVTITIVQTANGPTVTFVANMPVEAVFVKGGPGGNLYLYDPAVLTDAGLHAPGNDQGVAVQTPPWSGLSHISFCFTTVPGSQSASASVASQTASASVASQTASASVASQTASASVASQTASASVEGSVQGGTGTPEGSVLGGTGTPAGTTPDTALGGPGGPSPLPTIFFGAILLASLATLAWVNVQTVRSRS